MTNHKSIEVRQAEAEYSSLAEYTPGMVFRLLNTPQWEVISLSQGAYNLTGYTPEELMSEEGPTLRSLIVAEERGRIWKELQAAIKEERPFEIIDRLNTKSGKQIWVMGRGKAQYTPEYYEDPLANLPKLILEGVLIDITQQKLTELALRESKKLQLNIIDGSIEGILIHYLWQPLFLNKSFLDMIGYNSFQEVLALGSLTAIIAPHDHDRILHYSQARVKGEFVPEHYDFEAVHRDGSKLYLEAKSRIIDWKGQAATLSTFINITERKRAQQEAEKQRYKLAHTNRLNMMGEIMAGIAHELNQPLAAISSRCAAAKNRIQHDEPDLDKIKIALDSIEEQAIRSGNIIKQLRALVQTPNEKHQSVDMNELLVSSLKFIKMEGLFNNTTICTDIHENLPLVAADPVQIQQVILNLIRNASDAMQHLCKSDRYLKISAIQHDDHEVQVSVSDRGEGISSDQEENLFQSFYTTKDKGMGMGLSISRSIMAAHKGQLWFSRNPDCGVTFRITIPVY